VEGSELFADSLRHLPFAKRKAALRKLLKADRQLGLEGIVSKKLDAPYKSGPSKVWLKVKNPKAPAATRAIDGTF
jgi:ATP-dependent DNA ligase